MCGGLMLGDIELRRNNAAVLVMGDDAAEPEAVYASQTAHRSQVRNLARLCSEEPGAGILLARSCGWPGQAIRRAIRQEAQPAWLRCALPLPRSVCHRWVKLIAASIRRTLIMVTRRRLHRRASRAR